MLDVRYLTLGIAGLARAVDHSWTQGHFGCAVIAAYFLCEENPVGERTIAGIQAELDRMMASRSHLFEPPATVASCPERIEELPEALAGSIDKLCHGGHNVIYAALGLKALLHQPEMTTPPVIDGIRRLLTVFWDMPVAEQFHGIDVRDLTADADDTNPDYSSPRAIAESVFDEMLRFEPMYHEIQGQVGHLATHAQALIELSRMGYPELAERGHRAHQVQVRQVRLCHDRFDKSLWTEVHPVDADPLDPAFWAEDAERMAKSSWGYGHFFKYRYHFYDLLKLIPDGDRRRRCLQRLPEFLLNATDQGRMPTEYMVPLPQD